jgi:hypothetical protein
VPRQTPRKLIASLLGRLCLAIGKRRVGFSAEELFGNSLVVRSRSHGLVPPLFALPLGDLVDVLQEPGARLLEESFAGQPAPLNEHMGLALRAPSLVAVLLRTRLGIEFPAPLVVDVVRRYPDGERELHLSGAALGTDIETLGFAALWDASVSWLRTVRAAMRPASFRWRCHAG